MSTKPKNEEKLTKIYVLKDPDTLEVRYVGKTVNTLIGRLGEHIRESIKRKDSNQTYKTNWINSILESKKIPIIEEVDECPWKESEALEIYYIAKYKSEGYNLVNGTEGGEGVLGRQLEEQSLTKLRNSLRKNLPKVYQYDLDGNLIKEWENAPVAAETVFQNAQVQAGYTIADVMQIKAQWIGWAKTVNAAVALKAVENMTLEAGVYIPTASAERADGKLGHKTKIGAFWGMPVGPVALKVNAEVALAANDTETTDVKAGAGIDFDCGNGLGIGADVVYGQEFEKDGDSKAGIAISAWVSKSIPNGMFGVAFQCAMNDKLNTYDASDFTFAVPFKVNVGF